ncbi:hypothetical protein D3OALGA1CA_4383 [Olavius algarvensis associated proteobacterium Delta 3]|nr:hypothetical protein D3OALGA1CA_4383 [Olavius algarvensis associated proteobacterium Delta 3]CAB5162192.1 hypothetical protein D3OALGB2SA_5492 [Olavius algarvensis associated proteobacterium Delta 3]
MSDRLLTTFNFEVQISATGQESLKELTGARGAFSEVSGLEINVKSREIREGGFNTGTRQLLDNTTHPAIILRRGMTINTAFWRWIQRCTHGPYPLPYINGRIFIYPPSVQRDDDTAGQWRFENGIVTKVSAANLDAVSVSAVPIEELHIAHEGLTRILG